MLPIERAGVLGDVGGVEEARAVEGVAGVEISIAPGRPVQPLPEGDGQKLSLRIQSNGKAYQSYNFSFTEPWLGGKKRNSLTVSVYRSVFRTG